MDCFIFNIELYIVLVIWTYPISNLIHFNYINITHDKNYLTYNKTFEFLNGFMKRVLKHNTFLFDTYDINSENLLLKLRIINVFLFFYFAYTFFYVLFVDCFILWIQFIRGFLKSAVIAYCLFLTLNFDVFIRVVFKIRTSIGKNNIFFTNAYQILFSILRPQQQ